MDSAQRGARRAAARLSVVIIVLQVARVGQQLSERRRGPRKKKARVRGAAASRAFPDKDNRQEAWDRMLDFRISKFGLPVFTLQNEQALVQVSPIIINVACFLLQHSEIFGQLAS